MTTARAGRRGATGGVESTAVPGTRRPRQPAVSRLVPLVLATALLAGSPPAVAFTGGEEATAARRVEPPGSGGPWRPAVLPGPRETVAADPGWDTFRTFGSAQGLPQSTVYALAQDRDGFIYAGTQVGLARYDGRRWLPLALPVAGAAPAQVTTLRATADGALWIGTELDGLFRLAGGEIAAVEGPDGTLATVQALAAVAAEPAGKPAESAASVAEVWAATAGILYRCAPAGCREEETAHGLLVSAFASGDGPQGRALWLGTAADGVRRLDLEPAVGSAGVPGSAGAGEGPPRLADWRLTVAEGLPDGNVRSLAWWQGSLWVGSGRGVSRLTAPASEGDAGTLVVYSEAIGFARAGVRAFAASRDRSGEPCLWVAQFGGGLSRFSPDGAWTRTMARQGLPEDFVYSLLISGGDDSLPTLWAGSASSGVLRQESGRWRAWREREGLPHRSVVGIGEVQQPDGQRVVWAGTIEGAVRWAGGRWTPWLPELLARRVVYEAEWCAGALWVGTDRGLLRWDGRQARWFTGDDSPIPGLVVTDLEVRPTGVGDGELWLTTNHGLARLDARGMAGFPSHEGSFEGPRALLLGPALPGGGRTLWMAAGSGVHRNDGAGWKAVAPGCDLDRETFHLAWEPGPREGDPGTLWTAHRGGISRLAADGSCRTFGPQEGVNGPIFQLARDRVGHLYLFGHDGAARFRTADAADGGKPVLEHFTSADGLPDLEFNRAGFTDSRGRVWAATVGGITAFDPAEQPPHGPPGPLRLLRATARDGRPLRAGAVLPAGRSDVSFEYVLLSFGREEMIRYQTELAGLDPAPSPWRADSAVAYNRVPPGSYRFRVRARDANGTITPALELPFVVAAPWWRSLWAIGLAALALVGSGALLGRLRARAVHRRAAELARIVEERTRELAAANSRLEEAALTDPLTGAGNRRYLELRLPEEAAAARRRVRRGEADGYLAIVVLDLDHFKSINDRFGHAVGDQVLRAVAERLRGLVRQEDFVVRWGGEEFLVLLRGVERDALLDVARRVLAEVSTRAIPTAAGELAVTCSAGVVPYPLGEGRDPLAAAVDERPVEVAVQLADQSLYQAKQQGRHRAVVVLPTAGGGMAPATVVLGSEEIAPVMR